MSEEDPLEAALARARSPSTFVESRPFTLSRGRAIEKQREFALRDPAQVVLELVQAAVFAGASAVAVEAHPDRLMVAWVGGRSFTKEELEGWVDHLFADRTDPTMRPMIQLATGLNALLQRKPHKLSVETGDGERAFRLDLDANGNGRIGTVPEGIGATFVVASLRHNLWQRLTEGGITDELHLVEERCLYTPVPIYLNGRAPFGYRPTRHIEVFGADQQAHFDDGRRRGVVATHLHPQVATGFRTVVGGVWITTLPMPELRSSQLLGVVCDDDLRKTADHGDIVQDRRYVELLHAIQPHATEVLRGRDPSCQPPALPPVPDAPARQADRVEPRPLPEDLPSVIGRRAVPLGRLNGHPGPLFIVAPDDRERLGDRVSVDSFPFTVLVLDEGQVLTLAQRLPDVQLHRLVSTADVEFVRRALDRERQIREVHAPSGEDRVRLVQHREGALPDAGTGLGGLPFLVHGPDGLVDAGVLDHGQAISSLPARPASRPMELRVPLPGTVLHVERAAPGPLEPSHLAAATDVAWRLATSTADDERPLAAPAALKVVDALLLAQVLGAVALPVFEDGGLRLSLPGAWPDQLLQLPLATIDGEVLCAAALVNDVLDERVRRVPVDVLARLQPLAQRVGAGRLASPPLDRCVLGVGRLGKGWVWLEGPSMWSLSAITAFVAVYGHLGEPTVPPGWVALDAPGAPLVAWRRSDVDPPPDLDGAWRLLARRIVGLLDEQEGWGLHVRPHCPPTHLEGLARLARARLTPQAVAPRTLDEARVLRSRGHQVTLAHTGVGADDVHWVVQRSVTLGDAHGVVGLVHPFRPDAHVVVRTLHDREALPFAGHVPPVHGRLWSRGTPPSDLAARVRLIASSLDEELRTLLDHPLPDPAQQRSVEAYAIDRVLRATASGSEGGLTAELARRVELLDQGGQPWGSLAQWLTAEPLRRPPLPVPTPPPPPDDHMVDVGGRLASAVAGVATRVELHVVSRSTGFVRVDHGRSHAGQLVLSVRGGHPIAAAGLAEPGRAREVLLLELVRVACAWGRLKGATLPLGVAQAWLVAQRLR